MNTSPGDVARELRVLVVEDQVIVALHLEDVLRNMGCRVVGPAANLRAALALAADEAIDAAILDVNIDGDRIFPVAEQLQARGIPFILATGYDEPALPEQWRERPCLRKPFTGSQVAELVRHLTNPTRSARD